MTVYVDDYGVMYDRMVMCHMAADTEDELLDMADKIGVPRKYHQYPGTPKSHFDICQSKRKLAIEQGAQAVSPREIVLLWKSKREDCK